MEGKLQRVNTLNASNANAKYSKTCVEVKILLKTV